eukprot:comp6310_c0_seq1/m.2115 comp6310_c0_seq1/g.2115  ORF comp6310_c0_seq1/g.2115 comp6310_c0_seq1/m.2115 type:complete len:507 (-) comp6310_c0_seq1:237-1757(-)
MSSLANQKPGGYEFYTKVLKLPKLVVAPMVDQSELAWRMLSRRYNTDLVYTPMLNAGIFARDEQYRKDYFTTCPEDRPLIVQFCANNPDTLLKAAKMVEDSCDAIDLNLGCPQQIAKRGHYGSFLMEEWDLIASMVSKLHHECKVPVTCKIRVYPDINKTVEYAKMLERSGAQMLTVHGRTREMKGHNTGLADWDAVKAVKEAVSIPVLSNGNLLYFEDVQRCMDHTGVDGVMTAEANLYNPAFFTGKYFPMWKLADEYLELCRTYETQLTMVRAHMFKIYHHALPLYADLRHMLAVSKSLEGVADVARQLNDRLKEAAREQLGPDADIEADFQPEEHRTIETGHAVVSAIRKFPFWVCHPYTRPLDIIPETKRRHDEKEELAPEQVKAVKLDMEQVRRDREERKQRKLQKYRDTSYLSRMCTRCLKQNPGKGCSHTMCKNCCVHHCVSLPDGDCAVHRASIIYGRKDLSKYPLMDIPTAPPLSPNKTGVDVGAGVEEEGGSVVAN